MGEQPINLNVMDGGAFYAHEASVNYTPIQFTMDFKCITPRIDPRGKGKPSFLLMHNVVMLEPYHAKALLEVLQNVVKKYEEQYGKIQKPKALAKAEKQQKKIVTEDAKVETPSYLC
jgi:hypothetical protein